MIAVASLNNAMSLYHSGMPMVDSLPWPRAGSIRLTRTWAIGNCVTSKPSLRRFRHATLIDGLSAEERRGVAAGLVLAAACACDLGALRGKRQGNRARGRAPIKRVSVWVRTELTVWFPSGSRL